MNSGVVGHLGIIISNEKGNIEIEIFSSAYGSVSTECIVSFSGRENSKSFAVKGFSSDEFSKLLWMGHFDTRILCKMVLHFHALAFSPLGWDDIYTNRMREIESEIPIQGTELPNGTKEKL